VEQGVRLTRHGEGPRGCERKICKAILLYLGGQPRARGPNMRSLVYSRGKASMMLTADLVGTIRSRRYPALSSSARYSGSVRFLATRNRKHDDV
jgi:hypothetical protein